MEWLLPFAIIGVLVLGTLVLAFWAVKDLLRTWSGDRPDHRGGAGGGLLGGLAEIDRIVRPSIVHVERVDEEAESEQENDGE